MPDGKTLDHLLEGAGYASVPLSRTPVGHLGVDAVVNGTVARFLIDTGASATVVDRDSATRWSLPLDTGSEPAVGCSAAGAQEAVQGEAQGTRLRELCLADLRLPDVRAYVVDLSRINAALDTKGASRVDGVIGADILDQREAVITYATRTLHLKWKGSD